MSSLLRAVEFTGIPQYGIVIVQDGARPVQESLGPPMPGHITAGEHSLSIWAPESHVGFSPALRMELWGGPHPAPPGYISAEADITVRTADPEETPDWLGPSEDPYPPTWLGVQELAGWWYGQMLEVPGPGNYRVRALVRQGQILIQVWRWRSA
ncbi:hypothetical protein [Streptomyces sp. NPDC046685]|uniref:hypothetical protein n=1 Tax=Streptomyces sp. NPDC046685 TaxID=3157202 RepID=UPI0033D2AC71